MKKTIKAGLILTFASICLMGCTNDEAMTSSQVEYQNVNISFFDATIGRMGNLSTKADDNATALSQSFKRLDVALIPENKTTESEIYKFTQSSSEKDFGNVTMRVPTGNYTLVGIAHKRKDDTPSADIRSAKDVWFENNIVGDVAYIKQPITVETSSTTATTCSLKRAVALFRIKCLDDIPENASIVHFKIDKDCSFVFNPTTGFANNSTDGITVRFGVNKSADDPKEGRVFDVYVFPAKETEKVNITVTTKDKKENILNTMQFKDVTLQLNHVTTYTGKLFTAKEDVSFTFADGELTSSGEDKNF